MGGAFPPPCQRGLIRSLLPATIGLLPQVNTYIRYVVEDPRQATNSRLIAPDPPHWSGIPYYASGHATADSPVNLAALEASHEASAVAPRYIAVSES